MMSLAVASLGGLLLMPPPAPPLSTVVPRLIHMEITRGGERLAREAAAQHAPSQPPRDIEWITRHPALFGAAVGFGAGFAAGYVQGDDGVARDGTAVFGGLVLGVVGAGLGALIGHIAGR